MRREERHHLKENPLAVLLAELQGSLTTQGRSIMIGAVVLVLALVVGGGYYWWQESQLQRAGGLLAEAMTVLDAAVIPPPADPTPPVPVVPEPDGTDSEISSDAEPDSESESESENAEPPPNPLVSDFIPFEQPPNSYPSLDAKFEAALPRLLEAADTYPTTLPGITARYQAATALASLGRPEEAATEYQRVIDVARDQLYGQMAQMGLAETHLLTGRYEDAIALLEGQTGTLESTIPVDAVLMRLGRAYQLAGQTDDALAAFTRVVEEFPFSVYYADADREAEDLRHGGGEDATS